MKILFVIFVIYQAFSISCPKYTCTKFENPLACSKKTIDENGFSVQLRQCEDNKKICPMTADFDYEDECKAPSNLLPGDFCKEDTECFSGECKSGVCKGYEDGKSCLNNIECDVKLYCQKQGNETKGYCKPPKSKGTACDKNDYCEVGTACSNSICTTIASIANNDPTTLSNTCKSFYMENGKCKEGPKLKDLEAGKTGTDCPASGVCEYVGGKNEGCVCGMQDGTKPVCKPGEGDVNMEPVFINF